MKNNHGGLRKKQKNKKNQLLKRQIKKQAKKQNKRIKNLKRIIRNQEKC